jgi:hypothetical protein
MRRIDNFKTPGIRIAALRRQYRITTTRSQDMVPPNGNARKMSLERR